MSVLDYNFESKTRLTDLRARLSKTPTTEEILTELDRIALSHQAERDALTGELFTLKQERAADVRSREPEVQAVTSGAVQANALGILTRNPGNLKRGDPVWFKDEDGDLIPGVVLTVPESGRWFPGVVLTVPESGRWSDMGVLVQSGRHNTSHLDVWRAEPAARVLAQPGVQKVLRGLAKYDKTRPKAPHATKPAKGKRGGRGKASRP
jgi:hypothetical protein